MPLSSLLMSDVDADTNGDCRVTESLPKAHERVQQGLFVLGRAAAGTELLLLLLAAALEGIPERCRSMLSNLNSIVTS